MVEGAVGPERSAAHAVLDCWFGAPGSPTFGRARKLWFSRDKAFDAMLLERFGTLIDAAREGSLDGWTDTPLSALALVIVLAGERFIVFERQIRERAVMRGRQ